MVAAPSLKPRAVPVTVYECSVCRTRYDRAGDAETCAAQPVDVPHFKVGDIVIVRYGYTWFDGDADWIINRGLLRTKNWQTLRRTSHGNRNCFDPCCTLGFYYVITLIDRCHHDGHRVRYHLATKALKGVRGPAGGYTYNVGHLPMSKVRRPPAAVVRASKQLIGTQTEHLL